MSVYDAKTNLSRLLERVEAGERVVIARAGRPVADPVPHVRSDLVFGTARGGIVIPDDLDAPPGEVTAMFDGD